MKKQDGKLIGSYVKKDLNAPDGIQLKNLQLYFIILLLWLVGGLVFIMAKKEI